MTQVLFLENEQTKRRYEVLSFDKEAGTIKLKSEYGEFEEEFNKELFRKMGYKLVKLEMEDAE